MASLVYLHNKNNGVTYVYSNHSYRDKEPHKVKHDRKCIGHLNPDTGEVVPNRQRRKVDAKQSAPTAACNVEDIGVFKDTPKRGRKVEYNEEAIASYKKNHAGWFVLISNKFKDAAEALSVYRRKDAVEKEFDDLKSDLDMKRLRMHTPRSVEGRLFIQFLASILTAWLRNKLREAGWLKNTTLQEVVDEMKSLREVSVGKRKRLMTTLTSKQQKILNLYQITA